MNAVFFFMLVSALIALTMTAPETAFSVMLAGADKAVELALSLFAVYAVWLAVLEIMDKTGVNRAVNRLFAPLWKRVFKGENEKALEYISLNFSANLRPNSLPPLPNSRLMVMIWFIVRASLSVYILPSRSALVKRGIFAESAKRQKRAIFRAING